MKEKNIYTHTHTHTKIYICVCTRVCGGRGERESARKTFGNVFTFIKGQFHWIYNSWLIVFFFLVYNASDQKLSVNHIIVLLYVMCGTFFLLLSRFIVLGLDNFSDFYLGSLLLTATISNLSLGPSSETFPSITLLLIS